MHKLRLCIVLCLAISVLSSCSSYYVSRVNSPDVVTYGCNLGSVELRDFKMITIVASKLKFQNINRYYFKTIIYNDTLDIPVGDSLKLTIDGNKDILLRTKNWETTKNPNVPGGGYQSATYSIAPDDIAVIANAQNVTYAFQGITKEYVGTFTEEQMSNFMQFYFGYVKDDNNYYFVRSENDKFEGVKKSTLYCLVKSADYKYDMYFDLDVVKKQLNTFSLDYYLFSTPDVDVKTGDVKVGAVTIAKGESMVLMIDNGEKLVLQSVGNPQQTLIMNKTLVQEKMTYALTAAQMKKICSAKSIDLRVTGEKVTLDGEVLQGIIKVLKKYYDEYVMGNK